MEGVAFLWCTFAASGLLSFRKYVRDEPLRIAAHCARSAPQAKVAEILIYPVKSMRGHRVQEAEFDAAGLRFDRRYLVVDSDNRFVTQRTLPVLATIVPHMELPHCGSAHSFPAVVRDAACAALVLSQEPTKASGRRLLAPCRVPVVSREDVEAGNSSAPRGSCLRDVVVWDTVILGAVDQGDAAADWLHSATDRSDLRLVWMDTQCCERHIASSLGPAEV